MGRRREGWLGLGRKGGSHPSDRDQWPELALPSKLLTPAEKNAKTSTVSVNNKGTIDFIFGSAKSFYEDCAIVSVNNKVEIMTLPVALLGTCSKCYELRTRQHKMLNINALRPPEHYFHKDLMNFGRRSRA